MKIEEPHAKKKRFKNGGDGTLTIRDEGQAEPFDKKCTSAQFAVDDAKLDSLDRSAS